MNRHFQATEFGEVVDVFSGFAFKSEQFSNEGAGLPLVRIRDVTRGYSDTYYEGRYDRQFLVEDGDLLVGMDGEFNRQRWSGGQALLNQRVCRLTPKSGRLDPDYLFHLLPRILKKIEDATPFVTVKHLSAKELRSVQLTLPPLDEQRRIAAILDKADALRQKRKRAIALLDSLTQSIFLEMFGDPKTNPLALDKVALGDLLKVKSGNGLTSNQMDESGTHLVYGGNGPNGTHTSYMFDEPKIVIGRVGAYCGAVHVTKPQSWITDNALYVSDLNRPINQTYLSWALRMADLNQLAGRAAQPLISGGRIYPVEILLPSNEGQKKFDRVLAFHEKLTLNFESEAIEQLFASLQQRAFSGQL